MPVDQALVSGSYTWQLERNHCAYRCHLLQLPGGVGDLDGRQIPRLSDDPGGDVIDSESVEGIGLTDEKFTVGLVPVIGRISDVDEISESP